MSDFIFLSNTSVITSSVEYKNSYSIDYNNSLTSKIDFIRAIHPNVSVITFPVNTPQYYNISSSATTSSFYEFVRGYLYRDDSNTATLTSLPTSAISKTSGNVLTGFRMILFDRSVKADMIKPNSFRMTVKPLNVISGNTVGLDLDNRSVSSNTTTGYHSSITGQWSLSGSLLTGVAGSFLTGFTMIFKVLPYSNGPAYQTLFHRRVADKALSSLGFTLAAGSGYDDRIVQYQYGNLLPLSALTSVNTQSFEILKPYLNSQTSNNKSVITVTNVGGGQLNYTLSSNKSWILLSGNTAYTIYATNNKISSNTGTVSAYILTSVTSAAADSGFERWANVTIYTPSTSLSSVAINLPITFTITASVTDPY